MGCPTLARILHIQTNNKTTQPTPNTQTRVFAQVLNAILLRQVGDTTSTVIRGAIKARNRKR
jgi:hypothetical protein